MKDSKPPYTNTTDNIYTFMLILFSIESYLNITITDDEWGEVSDIDDIIELINTKMQYGRTNS